MTKLSDTLRTQLESSLRKWKSEIDEAEAKARAAEAEADAQRARADLQKQLWSRVDELKSKVKDAERHLGELKDSTEEKAGELRDEVERLVA